MYQLSYFEAKNFTGLYNGLGKTTFKLDLSKHDSKSIFIILGGNAKGKSTFVSICHPFSGTTDKRTDKFIREGKEGYKLMVYTDVNDPDLKITIKHVYVPNKTSHSTKSYIFKTQNGEELDLNPNGNVSSFLTALDLEFGITEDFLRLSSQNEDMAGVVKMTGSLRKDHIYKFIPKEENSTIYAKIITRKHRDVGMHLKSLVDKIGRLPDEVTIKEGVKEIELLTNELAQKRDKNIGKISKIQGELKSLDSDGSLYEDYKSIKSDLKELQHIQDKLLTKLDKDPYKQDSLAECEQVLNDTITKKNTLWADIVRSESELNSKKHLKSSIYDQMVEKESLLNQLAGANSKSDMLELLDSYKERLSEFDSRLKTLKMKVSADDLKRGIDLLENLRSYIVDIMNLSVGERALKMAIAHLGSNKIEDRFRDAKKNLDSIKSKVDDVTSNITKLNAYEYLKDSADKRPAECVIDTCAFLQDYHKWIQIERKIKEFETSLTEINSDYTSLIDETQFLQDVLLAKSKLENLMIFYRTNQSLISILPFNEKYRTHEDLLDCVVRGDLFYNVEDPFYDFIELLQDKEEYENIRNVKIPNLRIEIERMETNHNLIENIKMDIKRFGDKVNMLSREIKDDEDALDEMERRHRNLVEKEEALMATKDLMGKIQDGKEGILKLSNKFEKLSDTIDRIKELREDLEEREGKLRNVEHKLRPLTEQRDKLKFQATQLEMFQVEKATLEENYYILDIVRNALSTNKGMPVSILNMYVEEIRRTTNMLLSETFDGNLYLQPFEIDDKAFNIPMVHNGEKTPDVSKGSSSERSFVSTCLSMALIEQVIANYGVLTLDEIDATFSEQNKAVYCEILMKQTKRIGISQVFMITHSRQYYEPYEDQVCFILFPEHTLHKEEGKDVIKVY